MKPIKKINKVLASVICASMTLFAVGCDDDSGGAEDALEDAGDAVEDTAEKAADTVEDAAD